MNPTIAVLLTCHNRKDKTLQCLTNLFVQQGLNVDFKFEVFLVDDASTDGTSEAVKSQFHSVKIIKGDGNLFWNRGMRLAWETAAASKNFDYYLWLNDDTFLLTDALITMLSGANINTIVCGSTYGLSNKKATYGGYVQQKLIEPNTFLQQCDYFNGNCVLICRDVFEKIGLLDSFFHHAVGDFDYSLRAKKAGVQFYVASKYIGTCENHVSLPKWRDPKVNLSARLNNLYSATSGCYPFEFFIYDRRHNGVLLAVRRFITLHLRALFPYLWFKNLNT
ncbi:glycosyltransferase family 2 protein [Flavobacterium cellulosilyticum]|uniref:Glycosyltransferase family 2 protein n=1 Tax=Flavobacterium cellulosilyticum TaxID=2541731 RepID=A0A4R5C8G3_9FLAO|nr:glycosyltransferase family 2 protein [Flavobacterium cellulosilyticum]TDD95069.1 glycosyltransferase family 2 protein [Flavobacterium cellulosilyticum]